MRIAELDLNDPGFRKDPYPSYSLLRRDEPAGFHPGLNAWLFTRHTDIQEALRDNRLGRAPVSEDPRIYPPAFQRMHRNTFMEMNPPDHTRLRGAVSRVFTPGRVAGMKPAVEAAASALLDTLPAQGPADILAAVAGPLPVEVIAELLAIPRPDRLLLQPWSHAIVEMYEVSSTSEAGEKAESAVVEFWAYLQEHLETLHRHPGTDLLSTLATQADLSTDEIVATAILLLNAGHEATVNAAGNGLHALLSQPGAWASLQTDPGLQKTAVEEMLRYDTPLQFFRRFALEDVTIAGIPIHRGQSAGLLFGSANRDGAVFAEADKFNLGRRPNPHLTFGSGIHFCLGAPLARLELQTLLATMLERFTYLEIARTPVYKPGFVMRGLTELWVDYRRR